MASSGLQCIRSRLFHPTTCLPASRRLEHLKRGKRSTFITADGQLRSSARYISDSIGCGTAVESNKTNMDAQVEALITQIHASSTKAVIYATGGGFQALSWLLTMPGASRTLLDARVPYSTAALSQVLGGQPSSYASAATAAAMALKAYQSASSLAPLGTNIVGLACTAALVTDRAKAGDHKVHVAMHSSARQAVFQLHLRKGARDRPAEDAVASRLLIWALAEACSVADGARLDLGLRPSVDGVAQDTEQVKVEVSEAGDPLEALMAGTVRSVEFSGGQVVLDAPRAGLVYLPGSFNPLHDGHKQLLAAAVARRGGNVEGCFELSIGNADKGMLPLLEVQRRVEQFVTARLPVVITQAPLFTQKAELFPQSTFVVGYDTAARLVKSQYYGNESAMLLQFASLRMRGCSFMVAGRREESGAFKTLDDIMIPESLQQESLFASIPESNFRADISSTELRKRQIGS